MKSFNSLIENQKETFKNYEKENALLQKEKSELSKDNQNFLDSISDLNNKIQTLEEQNKNYSSLEKALKEKESQFSYLSLRYSELENLHKSCNANIEEELKNTKIELTKKSKESALLQERYKELEKDKDALENQVTLKLKEIEDNQNLINKLKASVQEKEKEIEDINQKKKYNLELIEEKFNKQIFDLNWKIQEYQEKIKSLIESNSNSETRSSNTNSNHNHNDQVDLIKATIKEYIVRIKNDLVDYEYLIDRRIISNLLLKYFDKTADSKLRLALLDTLSNIMGYDNDQRKKMGLPMKETGTNSRRASNNASQCESILDNVIEMSRFLEKI